MKLSKKVLAVFSMVAALAMAVSFTSCGEDDDDEKDAISKGNSDSFSIAYTNEDSSVYRGYKTTSLKHSGALTKVTMDTSSANAGAMGYIWDLESNSKREAKDPRRFCIVGFNYDGTQVNPYVSVYKNVTDISLNNFGAAAITEKETGSTATNAGATEEEIIKLGSNKKTVTKVAKTDTVPEHIVLTIDVYEDGNFTWNDEKTKRVYTADDSTPAYTGGYRVDVYDGEITTAALADGTAGTPILSTSITAAQLGYTAGTQPTQQYCAAYANVYPGKTLTGTWNYTATYNADEVVEE